MSRCIDLIATVAVPFARIAALTTGIGDSPDLAVAFTTALEVSGTLFATHRMAWQHPLFELAISYERDRVLIRDLYGQIEVFESCRPGSEVISAPRDVSRWERYRASFAASLDGYFAFIAANGRPPLTGRDGLRELQVEAAIRRSIASETTVDPARAGAVLVIEPGPLR